MGCLPTFGQIGYWAPILLVVLRFLQGFAVGGEWGGAVLLVAEHSPNRSRGFWASWPQAAVPVGNMLATVVLLVLTATLSDAAFLSWGWRVAFWLSAVVVLIGYYIRTKVTDAPIFVAAQQEVGAIQGRLVRRGRGAEALPARGLHRDGSALRREHHVLPGGHLLDHVPQGAGARRHQRHPVVAARRARRALRRHPAGRPAGRPRRPAPGVPRRCDRSAALGASSPSR